MYIKGLYNGRKLDTYAYVWNDLEILISGIFRDHTAINNPTYIIRISN